MSVIPMRPSEEFLTRYELADRRKVSTRTVDRWVSSGMPSEQWGIRVRRFRSSDVDRWLRGRG